MATEAIIFQQIVDINWDQAIYTASPNSTINVVQFAAKGSGANIGIALTPKGTGYISLQVPDGSTANGNARGEKCVDIQVGRNAANQVAGGISNICVGEGNRTDSGTSSNYLFGNYQACINGYLSTLLGAYNVSASPENTLVGNSNSASGGGNCILGRGNAVSSTGSIVVGVSCQNSGGASLFVGGFFGFGSVHFSRVHGGGTSLGRGQEVCLISYASTTTNAEVECLTAGSTRWTLRSNSILSGTLYVTGNKSDGSAIASYERQIRIKRVGTATSIVGTVNTIGTDDAAGTSISITADDTNEALRVGVTGVTGEAWTWTAIFHGLEKNL